MLPPLVEELSQKFRFFSGIGKKTSQKLALEVLQFSEQDFQSFLDSLVQARTKIKFCVNCGFFAQGDLCEICKNPNRNQRQICLVETPLDVLIIEKSQVYFGTYHVLQKLISPLENIFPEDTTIHQLFDHRIKTLLNYDQNKIELIVFLRNSFAAEATIAYLKELIHKLNYQDRLTLTRLAQGLPYYYNPETLDQATIINAIEHRQPLI
jgi:recombination protein RecR